MEIDYDYLRTGTAIGFRASHELCSNYLYLTAVGWDTGRSATYASRWNNFAPRTVRGLEAAGRRIAATACVTLARKNDDDGLVVGRAGSATRRDATILMPLPLLQLCPSR